MRNQTRLLLLALFTALLCHAQSDDGEEFQVTNTPLPDTFQLNQSYPDRPEEVECRPIRLRIERNSRRYRTDLVTNDHPSIHFAHADTRVMSNRLFRRLNTLADLFYEEHRGRITVLKAWTEYGDSEVVDPTSLHFEGRTVRVVVALHLFSPLLRLAVEVGFDWVYYADPGYIRMSVVPDLCDISLDLVFLLDQSGSVGPVNHSIAINFLQDVVSFFTVASNRTQVALVTYSTGAAIQFDLNDYPSQELVVSALGQVQYTGGWTATALALTLGRWVLDPGRNYGARPFSEGIPKVAVLITDGKSNLYSIANQANNLRKFGVQVYTVGIGSINLPELLFIASDPDSQHVFLLNSFNDAENFVDLLSFSTCDAPAIVEPGDNTTSEIEEEEFRFFQSQCEAFSQTVMIEQIDLVGRCSLYASSTVQNPGPLDPLSTVVRNETHHSSSRYVHLTLPYVLLNRFVYVAVLGMNPANTFSIVIWDSIFQQDDYTIQVLEGITISQEIINLSEEIVMTDATFEFSIVEGNEDGLFELAPDTGILTLTQPVVANDFFELKIVAQNMEHDCHKARVIIRVEVVPNNIEFPDLQPVSVPETAAINDLVTTVTAIGAFNSLTYSIIGGNIGGAFQIDPQTGEIRVATALDFETQSQYTLTIEGSSSLTNASDTAVQVINIIDENEQPMFVTLCALSSSCDFPVPENQPAGTLVGTVVAMDADSSTLANGMLTYTLQPDTIPFQVSSTGIITTTQPLNHEDMVAYSFTLVVQDGGTPPLSTETNIVVQVTNEQENTPPVFLNTCEVDVFENIDVGDAVLQCIAVDTDDQGNTNTDLDYQIIAGNIGNTFQFNPSSGPGVIVTAAPLDREERDRYVLTITATDTGGLSGTTDVTINIFDRNDNAPECVAPTNPVVITDAQLQNRSNDVTTIVAMDNDIGENAVAIFSIESSEPNDFLTSTVVTIRVRDSLDGTLTSTCSLTIQFEDACAIQQYTIDSSTGVLTSQLLCRVSVEPSPLEAIEGSNRRLFCPIVRNIPVSYRWLHNDTAISSFPITLPDSEDAGALLVTFIDFKDSGDYVCRAESDIGSLESEPSVLSVLVPPTITTPPEDTMAEAGGPVQFTCAASGIPDPDISWFRAIGSTQVPVTSSAQVVVSGGFLLISAVEDGDQGEYTCSASNSIGTASASAILLVFNMQQVVVAAVDEYSMPSVDESCHEFNSSDFNAVLTAITGYTTITTMQTGDALCPPSPCNPNPCQNGGSCHNSTTALHGYVCHCTEHFTGEDCAEMIDPCTETTCENRGLCASTSTGQFTCTCQDGFHGDHCQYTDICSTIPCPPGETCVETVTNSVGFICQVVSGDGGVMVEPTDAGAAVLDGRVNSYIETIDAPSNRNKRAPNNNENENGFITVCEARFISFPPSANTYLLVWVCPDSVEEPDSTDEELICQLLIRQRLVRLCVSPSGGVLELPPPIALPPTSVNISFILVDPNSNRPLRASEVLDILLRAGALEKLQNTSYRATSFSPAAMPATQSSSDNSGEVAGAVVGVVLACALVASLVATVLCVVRKKRAKQNVVLSETGAVRTSNSQNGIGTADNSFIVHNPYTSMENHPLPSKLKEQVFMFQSPASLSDALPQGRKPIFDDPIYEAGLPTPGPYQPPQTQRPRQTSTLERGVQMFKEKVSSLKRSDSASVEHLLSDAEGSGDYERVSEMGHPSLPTQPPPPLPPRPLQHKDRSKLEGSEIIYGNLQHQKVGAMGNAGRRWESYWQTQTLFRTAEPESDSAKK